MYWCNLRVAQSKGLQFYQTRSNAIILWNTLLAICSEKVEIRKSGEELYSTACQSPTSPHKIVLKPNLHCERQDTTSSDARTSFDSSSKHKENCDGGTYKESCRGEIDFQNPRIVPFDCSRARSHPQGSSPKNDSPVRDTLEQEALQADLKQNRAFNPFSEQSKEMIYCMRNMEYFQICEITHQKTMFQLYNILAERYCILHMRNMLMTFRQSSKTQQWPLRCSVDSQLHHQEGTVPWDTPQEHRGRESTMQSMSLDTLIR